MNRHFGERLPRPKHEIVSKQQRIVQQNIYSSPSPAISTTSHREVRTSSDTEVYPKLSHSTNSSQRSQIYSMPFCPSSDDLRDEPLGNSKNREYRAREHDEMENHCGGRRKGSSPDWGMGGTLSYAPTYYENYSLHVSNISQRLTDGEARKYLFHGFKKYGYAKIKVMGFGKRRHAYITFDRMEQAREALNRMHHSLFFEQNLEVTWSRSTLNQHPKVVDGPQPGDRHPVSTPHNYLSSEGEEGGSPTLSSYVQGGGSNNYPHDSPPPHSSSCDLNCLNISPEPAPQCFSKSHFLHGLGKLPCKGGSVHITDPNVSRTLFVGNLWLDVTERWLCDLFKPYGRIECVYIKRQKAANTSYAFVKFYEIADAMNAKEDMHERKYGNGKLKVEFGKKGNPSAKVWIGNLSGQADLTEISSELRRFGSIGRIDHTAGENHAFVHFERADVAQTAVNSLTQYHFKNTNLPLQIYIIQSIRHCPDSEYKYLEDLNCNSQAVSIGRANKSHIHSHMSPDLNLHSPKAYRGYDRMEMSGTGDYARHFSNADSTMNFVASSFEGSYRSHQGQRVGTEVCDSPSDVRRTANDDLTYFHRDPVNFHKRRRSQSLGNDFNNVNDFGTGVFGGRHRSYRGSHGNGSNRFGSTSSKGDFEFQTKRPRNCTDTYQYHKLHSNRSSVENVSHVSSHHGVYKRSIGHSANRYKDYRSERRGKRSGEHSSGTGGAHRSGGDEKNQENDHTQKTSADINSAEPKDRVGKVSLSPPPSTHPSHSMTDMVAHDAAYSAQKLRDFTGPTSFSDGLGQTASKPNLELKTLTDLSKAYPVIWHGNLVLKNTSFPTRLHLIDGDPAVAELLANAKEPGDEMGALRITQKLCLEPSHLEEVNKRMENAGHCILLALPGAIPSSFWDGQASNSSTQLRPLKSLLSYLQRKDVAGIVPLHTMEGVETEKGGNGSQQKEPTIGVLHTLPPCEFSQERLLKIAPNLRMESANEVYLFVVLVKGTV